MSDLNELFSRDPLSLSDQDIDAIIAALREARSAQLLANKEAENAGKKRRGVLPAPKAILTSISLDDILGGIV